jgi:hypothetical protein
MRILRIRAMLAINTFKIPEVLARALAMYDGMNQDKTTYASPNPTLPIFQQQIQNLSTSHQSVKTRVVGARATRDADRDVLVESMQSERLYVESVANATPGRAIQIIEKAGLLVAGAPKHTKGILTLRTGNPSGTVACEAYVALLLGVGAKHPAGARFFNWQYTLDGSRTFITLPSTPHGKTVLANLTPLTTVGVRVSLTNVDGTTDWSQVVSIVVR